MTIPKILESYNPQEDIWDELMGEDGVRPIYEQFVRSIEGISHEEMEGKDDLVKKLFMTQGITFTVYSDREGVEKIFPFDIIPRVISSEEWSVIETGIKQRLKALNIFLKDIYHQQFIIKDGIIPLKLIYSCPLFL